MEQIQELAENLEVEKQGRNQRNEILYEDTAYHVPVQNQIVFFFGEEPGGKGILERYFYADCA